MISQDTFTSPDISTVAVALGANWSKKPENNIKYLTRAVTHLSSKGFKILAKSSLYKTPAFPAGNGPDFVNAVILAQIHTPTCDALASLHYVETTMGRTRPKRWAQRVIDLDLVYADQKVIPNESVYNSWRHMPLDRQMTEAPDQLILPHPRLQDRGFVLVPLAEIAPNWRHPVLGETAAQMLKNLPDEDVAQVIPIGTF